MDKPTKFFGDNLTTTKNSSFADTDLKKKHVAISHHVMGEAVAAGVVAPFKMDTKHNHLDALTETPILPIHPAHQ